jgi:hypothetical protein
VDWILYYGQGKKANGWWEWWRSRFSPFSPLLYSLLSPAYVNQPIALVTSESNQHQDTCEHNGYTSVGERLAAGRRCGGRTPRSSFMASIVRKWPMTAAAQCKAWTVCARSNSGIVSSDPTQGMDVCLSLFCVCVVLCVGRGLATDWSPTQWVLPTVYTYK